MFMTALDGLVIAVILFSAFLAMVRGFSREVLSLASWVIAAVAAVLLYKNLLPFVESYLSNKTIALIASLAIIFVVVFLIVSIITMKIADIIIDSRIGALDRTVGFIFGVVRGLFIMVIAMLLINQLIKPEDQAPWLKDAKTKPMLDSLSNQIWDLLPKDPDWIFDKASTVLKKDEPSNTDNSVGENPAQPGD
ncbi:CvpA family protein [Bartonella choladocola]|uniref:Membrane protein required for colicin V production n=1 Tax=Bartonella choladocola TaxID=2750995 RepID=A0A1U9MGC5_9HYPH|nr:CvpA family protein [Bartonella choladocola]AQT46985.1 membrane protein required for colicin V production [Bartonella choladocola]